MDEHDLATELSKMIHEQFCEGMAAFSQANDGMPFTVAMNGIGSAMFTVLASIFANAGVGRLQAVLTLQEMTRNITLSLLNYYEDKDRPETLQ